MAAHFAVSASVWLFAVLQVWRGLCLGDAGLHLDLCSVHPDHHPVEVSTSPFFISLLPFGLPNACGSVCCAAGHRPPPPTPTPTPPPFFCFVCKHFLCLLFSNSHTCMLPLRLLRGRNSLKLFLTGFSLVTTVTSNFTGPNDFQWSDKAGESLA